MSCCTSPDSEMLNTCHESPAHGFWHDFMNQVKVWHLSHRLTAWLRCLCRCRVIDGSWCERWNNTNDHEVMFQAKRGLQGKIGGHEACMAPWINMIKCQFHCEWHDLSEPPRIGQRSSRIRAGVHRCLVPMPSRGRCWYPFLWSTNALRPMP